MPIEQANAVLECVDAATGAPVLGQMLATYAARCVEQLPAPTSAAMLERLGTQEAAAILRHLDTRAREEVLRTLGAQWVIAFKLLLSYPPSTVGAWVEPRVLTLPDDCNAGEARDRIARGEQFAHARIYVLDRARRVRGAIRGLTLLQTPNRKKISTILEAADTLWAREPLAAALEHHFWERNSEAPVINREQEFIGAISYADLRKAYRQLTRATEASNERELADVTELIAIGAGSLWQSLGELIRSERRR
jgi:Mg/Co/Ni transporter MgtE